MRGNFCLSEDWEEDSGEDCYDCDDNEEFDECEPFANAFHTPLLLKLNSAVHLSEMMKSFPVRSN